MDNEHVIVGLVVMYSAGWIWGACVSGCMSEGCIHKERWTEAMRFGWALDDMGVCGLF